MLSIALILHVLSAVIWVGGMFFAYMALRPIAATVLEPPQRLTLWAGVFSRFFPWVTASIALILVSGFGVVFYVYGGFSGLPHYISAMIALGVIMILLYGHVYFGLYLKLKRAVLAQDWPTGGALLNKIRKLIGINLIIGLVTIAVAAGGRFLT